LKNLKSKIEGFVRGIAAEIPRFWAWIQRMAGGIVNEKIKRVLQKKETSIEL
jgi:hypothetical protein